MDPSRREPEAALNAMEERLGRWRPAAVGLDRDRMLFEAGRAAAHADAFSHFGRASVGSLVLLAVVLGSLLVHERGRRQALEVRLAAKTRAPQVTPPVSTVVVVADANADAEVDPDSYLVLTHRLIGSTPDELSAAARDPSPPRALRPRDPPLSPLRARDLGGILEL